MEGAPIDKTFSSSLEEYTRSLCAISLKRRPSRYDYLELEPSCSATDIRKAYYHFARICHPDKCHDPSAEKLLIDIQASYDVLSDEYKRMLYDIKNGFRSANELAKQLDDLCEVMKDKYNNFLTDRKDAYVASVNREYERNGLIIKKAIYGDLVLNDPSVATSMETIGTQHIRGPFIDVTVQLQVMVENGVLHMNSGGFMSYAFLPGFYNPLDFLHNKEGDDDEEEEVEEANLYILYLFQGDVHEVTVSDGHSIKLPMKSHRVYGSYIKGPYVIANVEMLQSSC
ncbi:hypothetical protein BgAZ_206630 [Babesia gibsoni]|uniref:J domain-containing protein n=1 Tax=Babesia gibsoni TaxID=33632 RepID=A0AAD8USR9_BABGI|nr:hypothetical protein BgAZ_206630 [Babesia gibsoni]